MKSRPGSKHTFWPPNRPDTPGGRCKLKRQEHGGLNQNPAESKRFLKGDFAQKNRKTNRCPRDSSNKNICHSGKGIPNRSARRIDRSTRNATYPTPGQPSRPIELQTSGNKHSRRLPANRRAKQTKKPRSQNDSRLAMLPVKLSISESMSCKQEGRGRRNRRSASLSADRHNGHPVQHTKMLSPSDSSTGTTSAI
jgi:hypothetical protein